jgi:hypothetical protein
MPLSILIVRSVRLGVDGVVAATAAVVIVVNAHPIRVICTIKTDTNRMTAIP